MNFCLASATVGGALSAATTITDNRRSALLALGTGTARVWTEQGDLRGAKEMVQHNTGDAHDGNGSSRDATLKKEIHWLHCVAEIQCIGCEPPSPRTPAV